MAELNSTKLNAESHLLLDQPLLRMPYELSRRNFKNAQRLIEHSSTSLTSTLSSTTKAASTNPDPTQTLTSLDAMISKMQGLKRKLSTLQSEEATLHKAAKARLQHLQDLHTVPSLLDVKYDDWSRVRLSRLLVDYLLRAGYADSAASLARAKGIEELVDVDAFVACHRIERSLSEGMNTALALEWCKEHGKELKKAGSMLEFELRLQQYIEMVRMGHEQGMGAGEGEFGNEGVSISGAGGGEAKLVEARAHAKKYLSGSGDFELLGRAAGLLAYRPWDEVEPYASLYSPHRWTHLSSLFLTTHHTLYSLPPRPLLPIALSAGLSALKTPACHSALTPSTTPSSSVCPICSTELNELARNVPYAHHTKSIVENDPVVLPNGRVYGRERLRVFNELVGTEAGWIRDPANVGGKEGEGVWREAEVRRVFVL